MPFANNRTQMMFLYLALTLVGLSSQQPHEPENKYETCAFKLDRGDACCAKPNNTIRFYFDATLESCFTYLYEGCGGGRNTFYTEHECRTTCIPADKHTCGGNKPPTGSCHELDTSCPAGSSCIKGGLGVGLCCDIANEDEWQKETNPTCEVGDVLMRTVWYGSEIWIGKSCSHRFCPYSYDCVQGKRVAHCCGPIPNFKEKFYPEEDNEIEGSYPTGEVVANTNTVDYKPVNPRYRGAKEQTQTGTENGYRRR
ncbi:Kunitz/Bovine pancreatic trypsin inhibitor domain protein [Ancylostoma ceylanicum]|uniref:Kunitz/Bovine pancreatic trypsin inhibitor domain protein n=1 Tax=Ancylostoma ceylanicum TaxID=53326 RepID=A0A0D6LAY5_9BILA|nr:Kunitz/Bovine pancreatic trypsin inhibitor domain protein [Ancylostoma ceylanicum]